MHEVAHVKNNLLLTFLLDSQILRILVCILIGVLALESGRVGKAMTEIG